MPIKLIVCCSLLLICATSMYAQYHYRYIIVDSLYGGRYYGIGSDSALRKQYSRDSLKRANPKAWLDSLYWTPPKRTHYYMYVSPFNGDSAQYKKALKKYLTDSADFYYRKQRHDSIIRVTDSINNIIYSRMAFAFKPKQLQKTTQPLWRYYFIKPDELI